MLLSKYRILNEDAVDSPCLLLYPDIVIENIDKAIQLVGQVQNLRPHVKTHKMIEVAKLMVKKGISKFKCATIAEAEMLAIAGADDILLAYQLTKTKASRFLSLFNAYPDISFSCLIDNAESAKVLSEVFTEKKLNVYIDLNIGMNRSGILPEHAADLVEHCRNFKNIRVAGLHAYDGHIYDTDLSIRNQRINEVYLEVSKLKAALESIHKVEIKVVIGGTPTFHLYSKLSTDIEVSPGTFVFWDEDYNNLLSDLDFTYAAILLTRVVSKINNTTICTDLGHKSVSSENPFPRVKFLNAENAIPISHSEEHLVLQVPDAEKYKIGDVLYGVPHHVCPTVALYDTVNVVTNNKVLNSWKVVARNRSITV